MYSWPLPPENVTHLVGHGLLVYWVLMLQQQPGSYRDSDDDDEIVSFTGEETGAPGENHRPTASN